MQFGVALLQIRHIVQGFDELVGAFQGFFLDIICPVGLDHKALLHQKEAVFFQFFEQASQAHAQACSFPEVFAENFDAKGVVAHRLEKAVE